MHTYIHTYVHTHIHTCTQAFDDAEMVLKKCIEMAEIFEGQRLAEAVMAVSACSCMYTYMYLAFMMEFVMHTCVCMCKYGGLCRGCEQTFVFISMYMKRACAHALLHLPCVSVHVCMNDAQVCRCIWLCVCACMCVFVCLFKFKILVRMYTYVNVCMRVSWTISCHA